MKRPKRILAVLSRALKKYGRISARQNRVCPYQLILIYNAAVKKIHRGVSNPCCVALPLLGEVPSAHTGERGRKSNDTSRGEKKARTKT